MILLSDTVLFKLPDNPVQVSGVRISVTTTIVMTRGLVLNSVPYHTVLLVPGDGASDSKGQPPPEGRNQHP